MSRELQFKRMLEKTDMSDGASIERYALNLEGMTFRDILDLNIFPSDYTEKSYNKPSFKGGMGNLIEERYFGYKANSDSHADFAEAGIELKATCFNVLKNKKISAGERLVLTMIPFDGPVENDLFASHLWEKCHKILLVFYERDRSIDKYDQKISYVFLYTPPAEDLRIIEEDYKKIVGLIREGRADELSEGLTTYLGACTKGETAEKSWVEQFYPRKDETGNIVHFKAKKRAFSLKRQYMDYILHEYVLNEHQPTERIMDLTTISDPFETHVMNLVNVHIGQTDHQLAEQYGLTFKADKAQWISLVYKMLGINGNRAVEFVKAGITPRAIRVEENGTIKESMSLKTFKFMDLYNTPSWDNSELNDYLDSTRFFFVVFIRTGDCYTLKGCRFWNMPARDIDTAAKTCWTQTKQAIIEGIKLTRKGKRIFNNLPTESDNPAMHVRPKAAHSAYKFSDGTVIGDIKKNAEILPDGRYMTRQCFWLNRSYVLEQIKEIVNS